MSTGMGKLDKALLYWAENMPGGILVYRADEKREIIYANEWVWRYFECESEQEFYNYSNGCFTNIIYAEDSNIVTDLTNLAKSTQAKRLTHVQYRVVARSGTVKEVEDYEQHSSDPIYGDIVIVFMVQSDMDLIINAGKDKLTGLLGMGPFITSANQILRSLEATHDYFIIYFNITKFKLFNVKYGNENGDWMLWSLAEMLQAHFDGDLICRYSGDHFVILSNAKNIVAKIDAVCDDFRVTYGDEGMELKAGICEVMENYENLHTLCDYAKIACDTIKHSVRVRCCYYDESMDRKIEIYDYVIHELDNALSNHYVKPYFQPVIRTLSGRLCGFEALARWEDPDKGLLEPDDFIGALEDSHQIYKLDLYVLEEVCKQMSERMDMNKSVVPVSFNISRMDLLTCDIFNEVEQILARYNIPRNMIHIEMTESVMLSDAKLVLLMIRKFHDAGYEVWMDDFGSGYSSLNFLSNCEFDEIKLDMGFLHPFNDKSKTIIANTVRMAKQLGIQTVAEGVETQEQYEFLKNIGCEKIQGYFFGYPMLMEEATDYIERLPLPAEDRELEQYYTRIGKIEFVIDRPLALLEFENDKFSYLYVNQIYLDILYGAGRRNIEEIKHNLNSISSPLSLQFRKFISNIPDGDEFQAMEYAIGENYVRVRVRRIAVCGEKSVYQAEVSNITQNSAGRQADEIDRTYRIMHLLFDGVYMIDADADIVTPVTKGTVYEDGMTDDVSNMQISDAIAVAAKSMIHPSDRAEYKKWTDLSTIDARIQASQRGFTVNIFRTRGANGAYVWKVHQIMGMPGRQGHCYLYTILYANPDNENVLTEFSSRVGMDVDNYKQYDFWNNFVTTDALRMFCKDTNRRFTWVNQAFLDYYHIQDMQEILGKTDEDMHWHINDSAYHEDEQQVLAHGETIKYSLGRCIVDGRPKDIIAVKLPLYRDGEIAGLVGYFLDIEEMSQKTHKLENMMLVDEVTGFFNSRGMLGAITDYVDRWSVAKEPFAIIHIVISKYDRILHAYGQEKAEHLLQACARVMLEVVRTSATCARAHDGHFIVAIKYTDKEHLTFICDELQRRLAGIREVGGCAFHLIPKINVFSIEDVENTTQFIDYMIVTGNAQ